MQILADSNGCCNEPLVEGLAGSLPLEGLAGAGVELQRDGVAVGVGEVA